MFIHYSTECSRFNSLIRIGFIAFYVCFDQMQNNLISQAGQMTAHGVPNDLLPALNQVACIILGPLIQNGIYPFLHKRNIYFRPIARITLGFLFTTVSMVYAAVVQYLIYQSPPCYTHASDCDGQDGKPRGNDINVWIQAPVYFLIAAGEIFAYVTALEYAYEHAPRDMKVIVQAFSLLVAGIASACAMGLSPAAKDPYLVILYVGLASAMAATTALFWWKFRAYDAYYDDVVHQDNSTTMVSESPINEIEPECKGRDTRIHRNRNSRTESQATLVEGYLRELDNDAISPIGHGRHCSSDALLKEKKVPTFAADKIITRRLNPTHLSDATLVERLMNELPDNLNKEDEYTEAEQEHGDLSLSRSRTFRSFQSAPEAFNLSANAEPMLDRPIEVERMSI